MAGRGGKTLDVISAPIELTIQCPISFYFIFLAYPMGPLVVLSISMNYVDLVVFGAPLGNVQL